MVCATGFVDVPRSMAAAGAGEPLAQQANPLAGARLAARRKRDTPQDVAKPDATPGLSPGLSPGLTSPGLSPPGGLPPLGTPGAPGSLLPSPMSPISPSLSTAPIKLPDTSPKRTIGDCMKLWERATHMTKPEWRAACERGIREADRSEKAAARAAGRSEDGKGERKKRKRKSK